MWFQTLIMQHIMGRQQGAVEIKGKVGGLQFGKNSDGSPGVKRARYYSRAKMKKGDNYARTRDNNNEFTGSARAAQQLRQALGDRVYQYGDNQLQARLMQLTYGVLQRGPGTGGKRTYEVQPNLLHFVKLEYNEDEKLGARFNAPYTVTANTDRNTATLDVPSFNPAVRLGKPSGATDFRLVLVAGTISDISYTGNVDVYAADHPEMAGLSALAESAVLPIDTVTSALQLVAVIPGSPVLPAGTALLVSLGIEFYRTINNDSQLLASGNAMKVVAAY